MSTLVTRWVVREEQPVSGPITQETLARWVDEAVEAYLDRCALLRRPGVAVTKRVANLPPAERLGEPDRVAVSSTASEVHPDSFTISIRVRSEHDTAINVKCLVKLADSTTGEALEVCKDLRDQLIALEHAAAFFN
jgi:acyl-CoA thioesterase FadM